MVEKVTPDVESRPNVIWVIADQLRGQALGYAGDPNVSTPHLDRLAAEGHTFTAAVAGAPLCSPARASMLTGRFPACSGVAGHEQPLPASASTVATALRDTGYRTCYVGKWHLDGNRPELGAETFGGDGARIRMIPPARRGGFTDWWAYENNNRPFDCLVHTDAGNVPSGVPVLAAADGMEQFRLPEYESDGLSQLLINWLRQQVTSRPSEPFFAVLSVQPPHNPYTAPAENMARYTPGHITLRPNVPPVENVRERARRDLAGYYAAIERLDHNIGRLRTEVAKLGITDDTYIIVTSDHGDMHGSHGQWRKTAPWEESVRVPLIISGPSREHQETHRLDIPISHVDLPATILGLCGLRVPAFMQGTDLSAWLASPRATGPACDSAYIGIPVPTGHPDSVDRSWRGVVTRAGWKYVEMHGGPWLMFDLRSDPYEQVNLAHNTKHLAQRSELADLLNQWEVRASATLHTK